MALHILNLLILSAALGCALIGGVFFAFSAFIMKALGRVSSHAGIAAMQSINIVVVNPWFLGAFFGTAALCAVLVVLAVLDWQPGALYLVVASAFYIVGTIGVTMACNVPRNNALAAVDPASEAGAQMWRRYLVQWTFCNHVRTVAALAAAVLFMLAL